MTKLKLTDIVQTGLAHLQTVRIKGGDERPRALIGIGTGETTNCMEQYAMARLAESTGVDLGSLSSNQARVGLAKAIEEDYRVDYVDHMKLIGPTIAAQLTRDACRTMDEKMKEAGVEIPDLPAH